MDLQAFVREALVQIIMGITEAQAALPPGAKINPRLREHQVKPDGLTHLRREVDRENLRSAGLIATYADKFADIIEFDVP
jgi:hypothetical protein